jgi:hypothetical protein
MPIIVNKKLGFSNLSTIITLVLGGNKSQVIKFIFELSKKLN